MGIHDHDRLGVIGANGMGKSTLLRIIAGLEEADSGVVIKKKSLTVAFVPQSHIFAEAETALGLVQKAAIALGARTEDSEYLSEYILSLFGFGNQIAPWDVPLETLSGGWQRRAAIAAAVVGDPDVVLLDEPTNHLDLETIIWLEDFLKKASFAWVMVSHDRMFLEKTVSRIVEVSRMYPSGTLGFDGSYSAFVEQRAAYLLSQQSHADALANRVRREVEWLRRAPQARGTKAKGRVDEAQRLIQELGNIKGRIGHGTKGPSQIDFAASDRKTKRLISVDNLTVTLGERTLFDKIDLLLTPGIRLGLMGTNGAGKSTLLRILAGQTQPSSGSVQRADDLKLVYFDQARAQLDPKLSLRKILCPSGDSVVFQGRLVHIVSWIKRFQFGVEQLDIPVKELSGGEQARALIARLMLTPADVLLLDEPTNDLDIATLEALAESLGEFPGALVLVSHDRYLIDEVCNIIAGITPMGEIRLYADLDQWQQDQNQFAINSPQLKGQLISPSPDIEKGGSKSSRRLSYKEQREFDRIEDDIHKAESKLEILQGQSEDSEISKSSTKLQEVFGAMEKAQKEVERLYARWAELEAKLN